MVKLLLGALMVVATAGAMSGPAAARPVDGARPVGGAWPQTVQYRADRFDYRHGWRHHHHHNRHHGRYDRF